MHKNFEISAYAVITKNDQLLLCQLTRSRQWTLPGGGLEFGEDPLSAMQREVMEETGLIVSTNALLGVNASVVQYADRETHHIQIIYRADVADGELRHEQDGTTDYCRWYEWADLTGLKITVPVQYVLDHHLEICRS
ncbi:MAG: NUDIX domain-containing protein [Pseudomonadota bacterium]